MVLHLYITGPEPLASAQHGFIFRLCGLGCGVLTDLAAPPRHRACSRQRARSGPAKTRRLAGRPRASDSMRLSADPPAGFSVSQKAPTRGWRAHQWAYGSKGNSRFCRPPRRFRGPTLESDCLRLVESHLIQQRAQTYPQGSSRDRREECGGPRTYGTGRSR